jgi:hypothetical protein
MASPERQVRDAIARLEKLLEPAHPRGVTTVLADLVRRASIESTVDGFPGGSGEVSVGGGDTSDPTFSAVLAGIADTCSRCEEGIETTPSGTRRTCRTCHGTGRRWADPLSLHVNEILADLGEVARFTKYIDRRRKNILTETAVARERQSSLRDPCLACGRQITGVGEDRTKLGFCVSAPSCYSRFKTWRKKNTQIIDPGSARLVFAREIQASKATEEIPDHVDPDDLEALRAAGVV